jgi:hypothetical protein
MVETQRKSADEYKKETGELKLQLKEVLTMLHGADTHEIKGSSTAVRGSDKRVEKRKGAAPIS